jgi:hypothetical protein
LIIAARNALTAFVAAIVARHAFAFCGSTIGQHQKRATGHDKPDTRPRLMREGGPFFRRRLRISAPASFIQCAPGVENTTDHKD